MSGYKYNKDDEVEFYKNRCKELEQQLHRMDVRFNNILSHSGKSDHHLDQIMRENTDLHMDCERANKQLAQKRNEAELWKQKYETQLTQMMQIKSNYELELSQLSGEVQRLLEKIDDFEYERKVQDTQVLREQIQDKNQEIDELASKMQRMRVDDDAEMQRLFRENEGLRHKINAIELERQKELEQLRFKLEGYHSQSLDNLKKTHSSQIEVVENEIDKLRSLLEIKNSEIETVLQQNLKIKSQYEYQINENNTQYEQLKQKYLNAEAQHREQVQSLQHQLINDNQCHLQQLTDNYESTISTLEKEVKSLQKAYDRQCKEIQDQSNDKQNLRDAYEKQIRQYCIDLEEAKLKQQSVEQDSHKELMLMESELARYRQLNLEQELHHKSSIELMEKELIRVRESNLIKGKDVDSQIQQFSSIKKSLEDDLNNLRNENTQMKRLIQDLEGSIQEQEVKQQTNETALKDKIRTLESRNDQLNSENRRIQGEISENQSYKSSDKELKKLLDENEQLRIRIIQVEKEKNKEQDDLRRKLESSSQYQIENLKTAFNTQINILNQENSDFKHQLQLKETSLQDLLSKYIQLDKAIKQGQQLNADDLASRNIYEVLIRTKNRQSSGRRQQ